MQSTDPEVRFALNELSVLFRNANFREYDPNRPGWAGFEIQRGNRSYGILIAVEWADPERLEFEISISADDTPHRAAPIRVGSPIAALAAVQKFFESPRWEIFE
jgi:hypothetical protein